MQEENNNIPLEERFLAAQESYAQAQQRTAEENRTFARTEFFRMDKLGTYRLRILPLPPATDGAPSRPGYEYPVRQLLLEIERPAEGAKTSKIYVTVPRATDAGYSLDIIDTYRRMAVAEASARGEVELAEKIDGGSFGGGLRFSYLHSLYILDLTERAKGLQLLTLSHAQFKDLDEKKFKLWQKKLQKNPAHPCPVSSVYNAYPVEIEKRKNGAKTEYLISIDNESDTEALTREELEALMAAPRIPEIIYRYTRYQLGATVEFLRQCDRLYGLDIMARDQMREAIDTLSAELPHEDTSEFSFERRAKGSRETSPEAAEAMLSLDDLFTRCEELERRGASDRTTEGLELRAQIRAYIEREALPVRITRTTSNRNLLEMIDEALAAAPDTPSSAVVPEPEALRSELAPEPRRR